MSTLRQSTEDPKSLPLAEKKTEDCEPVDAETLRSIENSVASMRAGRRSKPVDLKKLREMKL